jgi:hypothetical protein
VREKIAKHTWQVGQDVVVPVPNDHHAFPGEPTGAAIVSLLPLFGMLSTIDLDRDAEARTTEVERKRSDRVWPSEMKTIELIAANDAP